MKNTKEYNAKYYREHREEIRAKKREKYKADPEKTKRQVKAWREANREHWNEYMRERRRKLKSIDKTRVV